MTEEQAFQRKFDAIKLLDASPIHYQELFVLQMLVVIQEIVTVAEAKANKDFCDWTLEDMVRLV